MAFPVEALSIVAICSAIAFATEVLMYFLVHSHASFKNARDLMDRRARKLRSMKSAGAPADKAKAKKKKEERLETMMKADVTKELGASRLRGMILTTVSLLVLYNVMAALYDGVVVARLPFNPPGFLQRLTHRTLIGDDYSEASFAFVYALCQAALKPNVTKLCGWGPSRQMASMGSLSAAADEMTKRQKL